MKKVTSISGGKTSAYLAANYQSDFNVFALVRTSDLSCKYPDEFLRKKVEDRIQKPFIGTLEDDIIIQTIFELEQFIGKEIHWVSGLTYDEVVEKKGGWLPNKLHRYCTTWLKLDPIFYWWAEVIGEPIQMQLGFRANEVSRANRMLKKVNANGLLEYKATFEKNKRGQNKWQEVEWQAPCFPLIENRIFKTDIEKYWADKPVPFARLNNCVGCFHRNPILLRKMYEGHPNKMEWFAKQEEVKGRGNWRSDVAYRKIINSNLQQEISFDEFTDCDSGYCGF